MKANYKKHILKFKQPGGTSRGILHTKETFFITVYSGNTYGIGECALFRGLSVDDQPDYEEKLRWVCENIKRDKATLLSELTTFPSIQFGLEQALESLNSSDPFLLFPSDFTKGLDAIKINGLIWMGSPSFMKQQINEKLTAGFTTLKMKIGALDFNSEIEILKEIRKEYTTKEVAIRVDANGAFLPSLALEKLNILSELGLHSIEQPIKAGQWDEMAMLCQKSPLDIALDEELIGVYSDLEKQHLLRTIQPQYIIIKPSLIGGFAGSSEWIELAERQGVAWWITSALESNIGLNAIAQYTYGLKPLIHQGLGTGSLFTNNVQAPLRINNGCLHYDPLMSWKFNL